MLCQFVYLLLPINQLKDQVSSIIDCHQMQRPDMATSDSDLPSAIVIISTRSSTRRPRQAGLSFAFRNLFSLWDDLQLAEEDLPSR
jgi:hypothetical protein